MKILTLGKLSRNKDEVKAVIEKLGGKLTGTANKASLCISTKSELSLVCKTGTCHTSCDGEVERGDVLSAVWHPQGAPRWVSSLVSSVVWSFAKGNQHLYFAKLLCCVCVRAFCPQPKATLCCSLPDCPWGH